MTEVGAHPTMTRLDEEIEWYDRKSGRCQLLYKWLKFVEVTAAAVIPVSAAFKAPVAVAAVLGALIVVLEGLQHVNQYHTNWTAYRATCEALKHEKYLYLAAAGPYTTGARHTLLAERIEGLISQENAKWVATRTEPARPAETTA